MDHGKVTTFRVDHLPTSTSPSDKTPESEKRLLVGAKGKQYIYDPSCCDLYRGTQIKTAKQPAILRRVLSKKQLISSLVKKFANDNSQSEDADEPPTADSPPSTIYVSDGSLTPPEVKVLPVTATQVQLSQSRSVKSPENIPMLIPVANQNNLKTISTSRLVTTHSYTKPILPKPTTSTSTKAIVKKVSLDILTDFKNKPVSMNNVTEKLKELVNRVTAGDTRLRVSSADELRTPTPEDESKKDKWSKIIRNNPETPLTTISLVPITIPRPHTRVTPKVRPPPPPPPPSHPQAHPHIGGHLDILPHGGSYLPANPHIHAPHHAGTHLGTHFLAGSHVPTHVGGHLGVPPHVGSRIGAQTHTGSHLGAHPHVGSHLGTAALPSTRASSSISSLKHSTTVSENLISSIISQFNPNKVIEPNSSVSTIEMQRKILNPDNPSSDNRNNIYIRKLRNHSRANSATPFERASRFFADIQDELSVPPRTMTPPGIKTVKHTLLQGGTTTQQPKIQWENVMNFFNKTNVNLLYSLKRPITKAPLLENARHELLFENGSAGNIVDSDERFYYVLCDTAVSVRVIVIPKDEVDLDERLQETGPSSPKSDDSSRSSKMTLTSHHKNGLIKSNIEREKARKRQLEENVTRSQSDNNGDGNSSNKDGGSSSDVIYIKIEDDVDADSVGTNSPRMGNRECIDISEQSNASCSSSKKKVKRNKRLEQVISQLISPKSSSCPNSPGSSNCSKSPLSSGPVSPNAVSRTDDLFNDPLLSNNSVPLHIKAEPVEDEGSNCKLANQIDHITDISQSDIVIVSRESVNTNKRSNIDDVDSSIKQEDSDLAECLEIKKIKLGFH